MKSITIFLSNVRQKIISHLLLTMLITCLSFVQLNCKKLTDVNAPISKVNQENVYASDATAIAVLTGIYTDMNKNNLPFTGDKSISVLTGLSSDELTLFSGVTDARYLAYYNNTLVGNVINGYGSEYWSFFYNYIFRCNAAIEGLNASTSLTLSVKKQLLGEAKFMRAFFYFYLVNLFGDVPLAITTDWQINSQLSRSSKDQVYKQVISDLLDANELLNDYYVGIDCISNTSERIRPNKSAVNALMARVYLYMKDWQNAEASATAVIERSASYQLLPLNSVFLKNSKEAIWQLQPINSSWNTEDARVYILNIAPSSSKPVFLSTNFLNSFEAGDSRRVNWVKDTAFGGVSYSYPVKYKSATQNSPLTEYLMVLRLAEQYLIRAEARVQQNNLTGALVDVNFIRKRAGLNDKTDNDKQALLNIILKERQIELFSEWGNRWLDLKRSGNVNNIMPLVTQKKSNGINSWQSYQQLYPLPLDDILKDQNLIQNDGY